MLAPEDQEILFERVKTHLQALTKYQVKPYGGSILFFEASQRFFRHKEVSLGSSWKELVDGRIEIQEISGNHLSILRQPQVTALVNSLNTYLQSEI